jgi:hypothetical protein
MSGNGKLQLGGIGVGGTGVGGTGVGGIGMGPMTGPPGLTVPELEPAFAPEPPAYEPAAADEAGGETEADVPVASGVPGLLAVVPAEPSAPAGRHDGNFNRLRTAGCATLSQRRDPPVGTFWRLQARFKRERPCSTIAPVLQARAPVMGVPTLMSDEIVAASTPTAASIVWPKAPSVLAAETSPEVEARPVFESMARAP